MTRRLASTAAALLLLASLMACSGSQQQDQSSERADGPDPQGSAFASQAVAHRAAASRNIITCHELIGGKPSPEPTIYELDGTDFYSSSPERAKRLISSEDKLVPLGRTEDDEGPQDAFASHTLQGDLLTRTVLWQRVGRAPRTAFVERYNFRKQTVLDSDGTDSCYHSAPPDGRTQEQAEWEALSGTCDPQKRSC